MALSSDDIDDIKQLLEANNHVLIAEMDERLFGLESKFNGLEQRLTQKFDDLTAFVTEAIDTANDVHGEQLKDHEARITNLEQSAT